MWNQVFIVAVMPDTDVHFKVMDEDMFADDVVGEYKCKASDITEQEENVKKEYDLNIKYNDG